MRNPGTRAAVGAALAACALLAAGCGGGNVEEKNAYVEEVNRVQEEFAATFERLAGQVTSTSTAREDRRTLEGFGRTVDETVDELRQVEPPEDVRGLHEELVDEISGYGEAIATAEAQFTASASLEQLTKAQARLAESTSRTSSAVNQKIGEINARLRE